MRAEEFAYRRELAKFGKPVDRSEWAMLPQVVNAVNLPLQNALNFPAAILQPPSFDPAASDAVNYGAIGAVIGHEISHSFDDQGSQFDAQGRLRNWWSAQDLAHFKKSSAALAAQFSTYRPFPDLAVNGQQTLSENIADLAGLTAAYDAYHASLADPSKAADQQFFIAFAEGWRNKAREMALRQQIATDGHAPTQYRVATVRNLDAWYAAFDVQPGQDLYLAPSARVRIW
jgi:predicted metalloendopeptidase